MLELWRTGRRKQGTGETLRRRIGGLAVALVTALASVTPVGADPVQQDNKGGAASQSGHAVVPSALDERMIALRHMWARREIRVVYKINGEYQPEAMAQINELMRDWRCNKTIDIDPKLIDLLYDLHRALGAQEAIRIVSGYRSEGYNASLLRAGRNVDPNSQHMLGHAVDIVIPGIRGQAVRDMAIKLGRGGVGYYPHSWPNFVHVDTGPVRQWLENDPKTISAGDRPKFRRHVKLDCDLTMTEVFNEISREKVLASLPAGASADPLRGAVLSDGGSAPAAMPAPLQSPPISGGRHQIYECSAAEMMHPLARLHEHRKAIKARLLRKRMAHRHARHHKRARRR